MTIYAILLPGQSNHGARPLSELPTEIASFNFGQTYIFNNSPYWGVLTPGLNTGFPNAQATWGLETVIAYNLRKEIQPSDIILMVTSRKGETPLQSTTGLDWNPSSDGEMFDLTIGTINAAKQAIAIAGITLSFGSVVWVHGESDALSNYRGSDYRNDLETMKRDAANMWSLDHDAEWIIPGVRSDLGGTAAEIAAEQRAVADHYICTHSLGTVDGTHYTSASLLGLGAAIASDIF